MELSRVIVGPMVTEKAERLKVGRTYTMKVATAATKIDVKKALKEFYDLDVTSVRVMRVRPKSRIVGPSRTFTKRHPYKKVCVTLGEKSKPLDFSQFKS
jgi:large subunit ribosomal protein L23